MTGWNSAASSVSPPKPSSKPDETLYILLRVRRMPEIIRRGASTSSIEKLTELVASAVPRIEGLVAQVKTVKNASRARCAVQKNRSVVSAAIH